MCGSCMGDFCYEARQVFGAELSVKFLRGSTSSSIVSMEVFIEEDQVLPVRVSDVVTIVAMGWTLA